MFATRFTLGDDNASDSKILTFKKAKQEAASSFCAENEKEVLNAGVNGIFPTNLSPKIVRDATACSLNAAELSYPLKIVKEGLFFSMSCVKVVETTKDERRCVDSTLSFLFSRYFKTDYTSENQLKKFMLQDLNAEGEWATSLSQPDFVHTTTLEKDGSRVGLAVIEFKNTAKAPLEQMGQAFASGCNIIYSHLRLGLKCSECAVPLVSTNGNLYQFAWVTLLEPSFPVLHVTTGVLDASVTRNRKEIAQHLAQIKGFCSRVETEIRKCSAFGSDKKIALDKSKYHFKLLKNIFLRFGDSHTEESLGYLWEIYDHLVGLPVAVLPLAFANYCKTDKPENDKPEQAIIFPNLEEDFAMGVPVDEHVFSKFLVELKSAIIQIHTRRVIHVDLYPSNILWRNQEDKIDIRIVDWDAATLEGDSFTSFMETRLAAADNSAYYWKSNGVAEIKCDYWFLFILSNLTDSEREAMNGKEPSSVNMVYKQSVQRQRKNAGDGDLLIIAFDTWFVSERGRKRRRSESELNEDLRSD